MEKSKNLNYGGSLNQHYNEVASVLNPSDIKFAGDAKSSIRFPDIECNPNAKDFWDKYDAMLKWLNDNMNEDGSWKYENIDIPKPWQVYVDSQLEAMKRLYEESKEIRKQTIEWIKTSKNIDISFEEKYWNYSHDGTSGEAQKRYSELSDERKEAVRYDKDKVINTINPFLEKTNSMERIDGLRELAGKPLMAFISKYQDGTITDSTMSIVTKHIYKIASDASSDFPDDGGIRVDHGEYTKDDKEFSKAVEQEAKNLSNAIKVADFSKDDRIIDVYMDTISKYPLLCTYAEVHPIDNKRVEAFIKNVVPMVDKKDSEVLRLWDDPDGLVGGWANGGCYRGDHFGARDFCIHALTSEINPTNIQELLLARRDVSADNYAAYEQNRNDAYELEGNLIKYRGFIHRESPGEHEVLAAMLKFYDTRDNPKEHTKAEIKLRELQDKYDRRGYSYHLGDGMFDLGNYEKEEQQREGNGSRTGRKEKVVDALRRLVENTDPKVLDKPKVEDEQLGDLVRNMYLDINKQSGEAYVDFKEVGGIVKRMNELLKERQGETGIKPSEIKTIAFVERIATFAMRGISEKDRQELPFDPVFKEICRFAELTSQSDKYDESDFESFWKKFSWIRDFDNKDEITEHFQMLSSRRLAQLRGLPEKTPFLKRKAEALWSGNLNNELLGIIDKR